MYTCGPKGSIKIAGTSTVSLWNNIRMFIYCELPAPHLCPADESIPPGMSGTVPDSQKSAKRSSVRLNKKMISKMKVTGQKKIL